MSEGEPIDLTGARRRALEAQTELMSLATLFSLALKVRENPYRVSTEEIEQLAEGVLKYVKPFIEKRQDHDPWVGENRP